MRLEAMRAIGAGDLAYFDARTRAMLEYVRASATDGVTDELHERFAARFDNEVLVGIGMLTSHYVATALFLERFDVPLETASFVGWAPSDEDHEALAGE